MPPLAIAAGVAAFATIGGAAISSHATSSAANKAAAAQTANTNANNALQLDLRNRNEANFAPYSATGLQAMGTLNGLLYGQSSGGAAQMPAGSVNALASGGAGGSSGLGGYSQPGGLHNPASLMDGADPGADYGASFQPAAGFSPSAYGASQPQNGVTAPAPSGQDAWEQFRNGSQYQWRLGQGFNALNQGLAGQGALHSGAAQKSAIRYGQGFASNELGNFINLLQGQQNLGFGGAQALAGVGNNYANNVTANNNNAADATSNASLLRGQSTAQFAASTANALGNFASSFGGGFKAGGSGASPYPSGWRPY